MPFHFTKERERESQRERKREREPEREKERETARERKRERLDVLRPVNRERSHQSETKINYVFLPQVTFLIHYYYTHSTVEDWRNLIWEKSS